MGHIIYGNLLLRNVARSLACDCEGGCTTDEYRRSANAYIMRGEAINRAHYTYIMNSTIEDIATFKAISE